MYNAETYCFLRILFFIGIDDEWLLQIYHNRDAALALWDAIEDYVDDIIDDFFQNDEVSLIVEVIWIQMEAKFLQFSECFAM